WLGSRRPGQGRQIELDQHAPGRTAGHHRRTAGDRPGAPLWAPAAGRADPAGIVRHGRLRPRGAAGGSTPQHPGGGPPDRAYSPRVSRPEPGPAGGLANGAAVARVVRDAAAPEDAARAGRLDAHRPAIAGNGVGAALRLGRAPAAEGAGDSRGVVGTPRAVG